MPTLDGLPVAQIKGKLVPLDGTNTRYFAGIAVEFVGQATAVQRVGTWIATLDNPVDAQMGSKVYLSKWSLAKVSVIKNGWALGTIHKLWIDWSLPAGHACKVEVMLDPPIKNWKVPRKHYFTGRKKTCR